MSDSSSSKSIEGSLQDVSESLSIKFSAAGDQQRAEAFSASASCSIAPDGSIGHGFILDPGALMQPQVGGRFVMAFEQGDTNNDVQPEAARTAHSVIRIICDECGASYSKRHPALPTNWPREGKATDRYFFIDIRLDQVDAFKAATAKIVGQIKQSDALTEQCTRATELSLQVINRIAGGIIKPHVEFARGDGGGDLHLQLRLTNVPPALARQLAHASGQDFDRLGSTASAGSRDAQHVPATGKDVTLRCDQPYFAETEAVIRRYEEVHRSRGGQSWAIGGQPNRPRLEQRSSGDANHS